LLLPVIKWTSVPTCDGHLIKADGQPALSISHKALTTALLCLSTLPWAQPSADSHQAFASNLSALIQLFFFFLHGRRLPESLYTGNYKAALRLGLQEHFLSLYCDF
jgi:hypothetical protein